MLGLQENFYKGLVSFYEKCPKQVYWLDKNKTCVCHNFLIFLYRIEFGHFSRSHGNLSWILGRFTTLILPLLVATCHSARLHITVLYCTVLYILIPGSNPGTQYSTLHTGWAHCCHGCWSKRWKWRMGCTVKTNHRIYVKIISLYFPDH